MSGPEASQLEPEQASEEDQPRPAKDESELEVPEAEPEAEPQLGVVVEGAAETAAESNPDKKDPEESDDKPAETEAEEAAEEEAKPPPIPGQHPPPWTKYATIFMVVSIFLLLVVGGGMSSEQPWLRESAPAAKAYFAAGSVATGVISCASTLGFGMFSTGIVSIGIIGSVGVFSVGFFSIGFFSIGFFSIGHVALGFWAWGAYSRWIRDGEAWAEGSPFETSFRKPSQFELTQLSHPPMTPQQQA